MDPCLKKVVEELLVSWLPGRVNEAFDVGGFNIISQANANPVLTERKM